MYEYGRGVPQDYTQAMRWYRQAADQGLKLAIESYNNLKSKGY
jgi:TPR repeat protein